ncbi:hypothetical protein MHYP_G00088380 [Metynnis hypsauchen]
MRLMEPFMDKGRTVTTDNFFTSLSLAQRLLSQKTTILGTVNKSRREIPQSARQMDRTEFTTQVFSTTGATLTVYTPKQNKAVYVLGSMHSVVETEDTTKRKPNTVTQYNKTKCGVDVMDHMVREYGVRAGTRRWPVAVFYNMIDMAALNAHVLYQACTGVQERRVDFLVELAKQLGDSHVSEKKAHKEKLLWQQPSTPSPGKRAKCQVDHRCTNNCATVRCVDCYKYTCGKCTRDIPWQCQPLLDFVYLHSDGIAFWRVLMNDVEFMGCDLHQISPTLTSPSPAPTNTMVLLVAIQMAWLNIPLAYR